MKSRNVILAAALAVLAVMAAVVLYFVFVWEKSPEATPDLNNTYSVMRANLAGKTFHMTSYNGKTLDPNINYTLSFTDDSIAATICNAMWGSYTLSGNVTIKSSDLLGTQRYCPDQPGEIEDTFASILFHGARLSLSGKDLVLSSGDQSLTFVQN